MEDKAITRRDFLASVSLATASAITARGEGPILRGAGALMQAGLSSQMAPWYDRTMRWIQIAFTEGDSGGYDPEWWVALFKRARVQGVCLTAGGGAAFYPTTIPFHHKAPMQGNGADMFGELAHRARAMGLTVVARTDSQACLNEAAATHPEWLNIDENGEPRKHRSFPDTRTVTCAMGAYNFDFMTSVHREIAELYEIDGLFCNRWQAWARGMCYCPTCQTLFRQFSGLELPRKHADTRALEQYAEWETARLTELWKLWDGEIRKSCPNARYFSNVGIDIDRAAELSPTYMCEAQSRGNNPPWNFGHRGKEMQAIFGSRKRIIGLAGMTFTSRHSVAPEAEIRMWLLSAITNGLSPWMIKSSATNWDDRWIPALERVYTWHAENETYLHNQESLATVGVLFRMSDPRDPLLGTGASNALGGEKGIDDDGLHPSVPANDEIATAGFYQALVEARIPFDMVYGRKLDAPDIDRYKVLILPDAARLTDEECEKLRQYVKRGGSLVATYQTSLYAQRVLRSDFALADLFGVSYDGGSEDNGPNGYMRVEHATGHSILRGFEQTRQIVTSAKHVNVRSVAAFSAPPLTRIPTYPTDPMEEIFPPVSQTNVPEVYTRTFPGGGRIVYFPGDIDATFAKTMAPDLARLMQNAVLWAANQKQSVSVRGPGILEVTHWSQEHSMTVHLLNCTNSFMLRSAYREDIPVGHQRVIVHIPQGRSVKGVKLLVSKTRAVFTNSGQTVEIDVPSVTDHEVIAVDFS